jgi:PAS domain S-box-containing protein
MARRGDGSVSMGTIAQSIVTIDAYVRMARQKLAKGGGDVAGSSRGAAGAEAALAGAEAALAGAEAALAELREAEAVLRTESRHLAQTQHLLEKERRRYADLFELAPDAYLVTDPEGIIRDANHAASYLLNVQMRFLLGLPLANFIVLDDRTAVRRHLVRLTRRTGRARDADSATVDFVRILPRRGMPFEASLTLSPVREETTGKLTAARWLLRDMTERARAEEERQRILVDAVEDYAIFRIDTAGLIESWNRGAQILFGYTEAEAVGTEAVCLKPDAPPDALQTDLDLAHTAGRAEQGGWHVRKDGSRFYAEGLLISLPIGGRASFVAILRDVTVRRLTEEAHRNELEQRVAERTVALEEANTALAAEIAERRLAEAARRDLLNRLVTAQEEERRRISRELHDQMGQHLTALALGLKALETGLDPALPAGRQLVTLMEMTETMGREAHRLAVELRPPALDDLGLEQALRGYVEEWAQHTSIRADFHARGYPEEKPWLPGSIETTLYRVVQEALNNMLKHAQATRAGVLLHCQRDHITLIVEDDGCGFDSNGLTTGAVGDRPRLGLLGLRERAALVGGEMTVESAPGAGTTLFVRLPLTEEAVAQEEDGEDADERDGREGRGARHDARRESGTEAARGAGGRPRDRARRNKDAGERAAGHGGGR